MDALALIAALWTVPVPEPVDVDAVLSRFPNHETTIECLDLAREHLRWLETDIAVFPWKRDYREQWLLDARFFVNAWAALKTCQERNRCPDLLDDLRVAIGNEAYFAGRMPPPMPYWWFTEIGL